jgi:hypothetical protein
VAAPQIACRRLGAVAIAAVATFALGCDRAFEGGGDLRAQRVVLEREVEGLRAVVARLERGEPMLPAGDIAIAVGDLLVRDLIVAQLPFVAEVDRVRVELTDADVQFAGSPTVQLRGRLQLRDRPDVTAAITLFGALDEIAIERDTATLRAVVAADHLTIEEATGLAQYLSGAALDETARRIRLEVARQLPVVRIPVRIQPQVDIPSLTDGPVRITGARLPLDVTVSEVVAARGHLWVGVRVTPGAFAPLPEPATAAGLR